MKASFDAKLKQSMTNKTGKNVKIFDNKRYEEKIQRMEELRTNHQAKWVPEVYVLVKNHKVMDMVREDNTVIKTLVKVDPKTGNKKDLSQLKICLMPSTKTTQRESNMPAAC